MGRSPPIMPRMRSDTNMRYLLWPVITLRTPWGPGVPTILVAVGADAPNAFSASTIPMQGLRNSMSTVRTMSGFLSPDVTSLRYSVMESMGDRPPITQFLRQDRGMTCIPSSLVYAAIWIVRFGWIVSSRMPGSFVSTL